MNEQGGTWKKGLFGLTFDTGAVKKCLGLPRKKELLWLFWDGMESLGGLRGERWETHMLSGGCQAMSGHSLAARLPICSFVAPFSHSDPTPWGWIELQHQNLCLANQAPCVNDCICISLVTLHCLCWACQHILEGEAVKPKWWMKSVLFVWLFLSGMNSGAGVLAFVCGAGMMFQSPQWSWRVTEPETLDTLLIRDADNFLYYQNYC